MPAINKKDPIDLGQAVAQAWATNERINQFLLEALDDSVWDVKPPSGKGRTIAAIVSHVHNVRLMWLAVSAKGRPAPSKLDRKTATRKDALKALVESGKAVQILFGAAVANGGHVKDFKPDVVGLLGYMVSHEAHHRGQICMQARALGHQLPDGVGWGMWDWKKRWQECGFGG